ncbi:MAG: transposase [Anaerolineales bacterium]
MDKFKGKYRIPSARWPSWDYGSNAAYFITICTAHWSTYFGRIVDGAMIRSSLGQAARDCWCRIPDHFPFAVLGASVVMPNHVHGVITIDKPDGVNHWETNTFGPQSRNLASIVRGYKIGVTKYAYQHGIAFEWQARYYDHVIRNADDYERIERYISQNPQN